MSSSLQLLPSAWKSKKRILWPETKRKISNWCRAQATYLLDSWSTVRLPISVSATETAISCDTILPHKLPRRPVGMHQRKQLGVVHLHKFTQHHQTTNSKLGVQIDNSGHEIDKRTVSAGIKNPVNFICKHS